GYLPRRNDLASLDSTESANRKRKSQLLSPENVPQQGWNQLRIKREGMDVGIELNGEPLTSVEIRKDEKPGIFKYSGQAVRVRRAELTGDWPTEFPSRWLRK
ncbi:MAG: DUF1583 domain-containing protein, partial [Planctomycetota bacterium]